MLHDGCSLAALAGCALHQVSLMGAQDICWLVPSIPCQAADTALAPICTVVYGTLVGSQEGSKQPCQQGIQLSPTAAAGVKVTAGWAGRPNYGAVRPAPPRMRSRSPQRSRGRSYDSRSSPSASTGRGSEWDRERRRQRAHSTSSNDSVQASSRQREKNKRWAAGFPQWGPKLVMK